jgi:hypothetical protein
MWSGDFFDNSTVEEYLDGNDSDKWQQEHEDGFRVDGVPVISASNAANIFPACGFKSPAKFFRVLRGEEKSAPNDYQKELFKYGHDHEGTAMSSFNRVFGVYLCDTRHRTFGKYIRATPDMIAVREHMWVNVEIKCPFSKQLPDDVPDKYLVQCMLQMHLMRPFISAIEETVLYYWTPVHTEAYNVQYNKTVAEQLFDELVEFQRAATDSSALPKTDRGNLKALLASLRTCVTARIFFPDGRAPGICTKLH